MATTAEIADFLESVEYDNLPGDVVDETKKRLLDSVGVALGAVGEEPVEAVRRTALASSAGGGDGGAASLWASTETAGPADAAMVNTALTRYLDFMDSFLAPGETPHPSDNVGSAVAAAEYADRSGADLLAGVAAAYELQGELAWNAPVRDRGFDHVTHTVLTQAAAAATLLGLDREATRNALGVAGTAHNALRVTRTGGINEWKGLASANAARNGVYAALLAGEGVAGPTDLFEGQKGWNQVVAGGEFDLDLDPACPRLHDVMAKRYVAETYAQSAVEAVVELAEREDLDPADVSVVHLDTFAGAKLIIGGGEGSRYEVETRAQADHSLPYVLAAALIDRELTDAQYRPDRIRRDDVQALLRKVTVEEDPALTERFEAGQMPAVLDVETVDGTTHHVEKEAFRGHPTEPMSWADVAEKFHSMASSAYDEPRREEIVEVVRDLENRETADLLAVLD